MADLSIPHGPHDLTPEWLTDALRSTGTIRKVSVKSFDLQPDIAAGTGFMGQLADVSLHYDTPEEGAPATLIAKFPTPVPENREVADTFRFYEIETRFYEEIAEEVELRTPRRYYSARDTKSTDFVLLLEDLSPARVGDQVTGCRIEQAQLAISELAKFHATWWESPRLAELDWMPVTNDPVRAQSAQDNYQQAWAPFVESFGDQVPAEILKLGEQFGTRVVDLMNQLAKPPRTIMHGDYRLDNLFFATPEGGDPLAVVDWQIANRGRGIFDVAYFMTGTLQPAERRARELDLVRMYHGILVERGVAGYDFDQCFHDYRASTLFCWLYVVIVLGTLDVATDRGLALFTTNMERGIAALQDLKAADLLPA